MSNTRPKTVNINIIVPICFFWRTPSDWGLRPKFDLTLNINKILLNETYLGLKMLTHMKTILKYSKGLQNI